jgi:hypothetical protein
MATGTAIELPIRLTISIEALVRVFEGRTKQKGNRHLALSH